MKKVMYRGVVCITVSLASVMWFGACTSEEEALPPLAVAANLRAAAVGTVNLQQSHFTGTPKTCTITTGGTYVIPAGAILNGNIVVNAAGSDVIIKGSGTLQGIYNGDVVSGSNPGATNAGNHIQVTACRSIVIQDITIKGDGSNAIRIGDGIGNNPLVTNIKIQNPASSPNRPNNSGGGGVEIGKGTLSNSHIVSGDDAIKISEPGATARNCTVKMQGNGSAIQFGYRSRCNGTGHTAANITVEGYTRVTNNQGDFFADPNYAVVGGAFESTDVQTLSVTGLIIKNSQNFRHIIKLVADGGTVNGVNIVATAQNGYTNHARPGTNQTFHAVALGGINGGRISNITIGLSTPNGSNATPFNFNTHLAKTGNVSGTVNNKSL